MNMDEKTVSHAGVRPAWLNWYWVRSSTMMPGPVPVTSDGINAKRYWLTPTPVCRRYTTTLIAMKVSVKMGRAERGFSSYSGIKGGHLQGGANKRMVASRHAGDQRGPAEARP